MGRQRHICGKRCLPLIWRNIAQLCWAVHISTISRTAFIRFYCRFHSQNGKTVTSAQIFNGHAGRRIARHHQSLYALLGNSPMRYADLDAELDEPLDFAEDEMQQEMM